MSARFFLSCLLLTFTLVVAGCTGSTDPVNNGKDKPAPPTKDK